MSGGGHTVCSGGPDYKSAMLMGLNVIYSIKVPFLLVIVAKIKIVIPMKLLQKCLLILGANIPMCGATIHKIYVWCSRVK